jgi:formylglycine-generating enzyme required for sulfatase activity
METITGEGRKGALGEDDEGVFLEGRIVTLQSFAIASRETSWELWQEVYDWAAGHGYRIAHRGKGLSDGSPVTDITWRDAIVWCNAYSEMEGLDPVYYAPDGVLRESNAAINILTTLADTARMELGNKGYRLPLEAEWEFVARDSNGLGLFGMSGDIAEWCWDWLNRDGITAETPVTGDGPGIFAHRVIRGGGWSAELDSAFVTNRNYFRPWSSAPNISFRVARSL